MRKWVLFPISSISKENKKKTTEEMKLKEIFLKAMVFLQQSSIGEYIRNEGRPHQKSNLSSQHLTLGPTF